MPQNEQKWFKKIKLEKNVLRLIENKNIQVIKLHISCVSNDGFCCFYYHISTVFLM
jgi:hypothetical protein